jgi:hypothetical protein
MDTEDSTSPSHKRIATSDPDHQKNKGTKTMHGYEPRAHHYWYGFPVMEAIVAAGGRTLEANKLPIPELVELGWLENEAQDITMARQHSLASHNIFDLSQEETKGQDIGTISLKSPQKSKLTPRQDLLLSTTCFSTLKSQVVTIVAATSSALHQAD